MKKKPNKESNEKEEIIWLIIILNGMSVVFKIYEKFLPEPLSFMIPLAILISCVTYLIRDTCDKN